MNPDAENEAYPAPLEAESYKSLSPPCRRRGKFLLRATLLFRDCLPIFLGELRVMKRAKASVTAVNLHRAMLRHYERLILRVCGAARHLQDFRSTRNSIKQS